MKEMDGFLSYNMDDTYYLLYMDINGDPPYTCQLRRPPKNRDDHDLVLATVKSDDLVALAFKAHKKYAELVANK